MGKRLLQHNPPLVLLERVFMAFRNLLCFCLFLACTLPGNANTIQRGRIAAQRLQASTPSTSPAQRLVEEFIGLINSGNRIGARSFIERSYTAAALAEETAAERVNAISELHDKSRGLETHSLRETTPGIWTAIVHMKLTGQWVRFTFELELQPALRIKSFDWNYSSAPRGAEPPPRRLSKREIARELDAFMRKMADADVFSGAVLLAKDGKVLFKKAYGEANKNSGEPNRTDTKLNLASLNKMFTAVAITQLVEQGKLSFDDPLSKFLPDFPTREAAQKIKIKHLLTHTSGLGDCFNERWYASSRERFRKVDDYLELVKNEAPTFEPGTRRRYSNTSYMVLGKVVEIITGHSYFDYVRENIYRRAGMASTDAYELDRVNKNLALGYDKQYTDDGIAFRNNLYLHSIRGTPAGGGFSTVEDLLRFVVALRAGKLVGGDYVRTMMSPKPELNSPNYGYGFGVIPEDGIVAHSGGAEGIGAHLEMTDDGYTFAVLSNYGGAMSPITLKIREMVVSGKSTTPGVR